MWLKSWTDKNHRHEHLVAGFGDHVDKATSIWNIALVLGDLKEYGKAEERLREAIERYQTATRREYGYRLKGQHGLTALCWIAGNGYDPAVKLLLTKEGIDPDLHDSQYGRTPLFWAAEGGHEAVVRLLLETDKAEIDIKDNIRRTPLLEAAHGGYEAIVKLLLETGKVDVDTKDNIGQTALQAAAEGGHLAIVERLLHEKVDVNAAAAARDGRTALQAAVGGGHLYRVSPS